MAFGAGPEFHPPAPYWGGERYGGEAVDNSRTRAEKCHQEAAEDGYPLEYRFTPANPPLILIPPFVFPVIILFLYLSLLLSLYRYAVRPPCIVNVFSPFALIPLSRIIIIPACISHHLGF